MPIQYVNRKGDTYFLHESKTKTGKPKWFFSKKTEGTLAEAIPAGYEIYENHNAQVFLRTIVPMLATKEEIETVELGVRKPTKLRYFVVEAKSDSIIVFIANQQGGFLEESVASRFGITDSEKLYTAMQGFLTYSPMMRFNLVDEKRRRFAVERWCFLGSIDDWFPLKGSGHGLRIKTQPNYSRFVDLVKGSAYHSRGFALRIPHGGWIMAPGPLGLQQHFRTLQDPRRVNSCQHRLLDVIAIAICAVIANADDWQGIETFGHDRHDWLKTFLELPNGIPCHDTFERIFDALDPQAFQQCLLNWLHALRGLSGVKQVAIDGKVLRGSGKGCGPLAPLHLVNAWATEQAMHLGQVAVAKNSNEITAVPKLLELLALEGALVTLDAMHCQKETAQKIRAGGGDYLLTVKGNQPQLRDEIEACFVQAFDGDMAGVDHDRYETEESGHGRREKRVYTVIYEPQGVDGEGAWTDLRVIGQCYRERTEGGKTANEMHYFIGSRRLTARRYGMALRGHWRIENNLHWQMDVTFGEDANREQGRIGGQNLAGLRRLALSLLKQQPSKKSIAQKRLSAAYNTRFLEEILAPHGKLQKS